MIEAVERKVAFQWHEGCLGPAQGTVDGQCARGIFE